MAAVATCLARSRTEALMNGRTRSEKGIVEWPPAAAWASRYSWRSMAVRSGVAVRDRPCGRRRRVVVISRFDHRLRPRPMAQGRRGDVRHSPRWRALVEDLRHMTAAWDQTPARVVAWARCVRLPLYPADRCGDQLPGGGVVLASRAAAAGPVAAGLTIRSAGAEIHPAARLGAGFAIIHTVGIVDRPRGGGR